MTSGVLSVWPDVANVSISLTLNDVNMSHLGWILVYVWWWTWAFEYSIVILVVDSTDNLSICEGS